MQKSDIANDKINLEAAFKRCFVFINPYTRNPFKVRFGVNIINKVKRMCV